MTPGAPQAARCWARGNPCGCDTATSGVLVGRLGCYRSLTETWRRWGHDIGFGIGIAHGFATLGTIGFEGRFDYAAIGTVSINLKRLTTSREPVNCG